MIIINVLSELLLSAGLSCDAFAAAVSKGTSEKINIKKMLITGAWFGFFQSAMPLTGYFTADIINTDGSLICKIISFFLLFIIGINMIINSGKDEKCKTNGSFSVSTMLMLSVATSIDALSAGAAVNLDKSCNIIILSVSAGLITFILSASGIRIGSMIGNKYNRYAEITGGIILIIIAFKNLIGYFH